MATREFCTENVDLDVEHNIFAGSSGAILQSIRISSTVLDQAIHAGSRAVADQRNFVPEENERHSNYGFEAD